MPSNPTTTEMGERHELYLAEVFAGAKTRASGSQWHDQGDVRNSHDDPFAFCVDGKSTLGKSISVSLAMIEKIREQAQGESPALGLRFYANANLDQVTEDWVAVTGADWEAVLASARRWRRLADWLVTGTEDGSLAGADDEDLATFLRAAVAAKGMTTSLRASLKEAHDALLSAGETIAVQRAELEGLRAAQQPRAAVMARWVPRLPWRVIHLFTDEERKALPDREGRKPVGIAVDHAPDGTQRSSEVYTVHVDRSVSDRPRLFADNRLVRDGDLYGRDGALQVRAWSENPSAEVG